MNAEQLHDAVNELVTYNWKDELHDFEDQIENDELTHTHIFRTLVALDNFLSGTVHPPESYIVKTENTE